jgi:LDH2 family malate/lactate/ureidoglycolate dehydrogenase
VGRIQQNNLYDCANEIILAAGESQDCAAIVADSMVRADARGITTHGTYLLTPIVNRVKENQLSLPTRPKIIRDEMATACVDGGNGLGAATGKLAVDTAVERATEYGVSLVTIRNTNNVGYLAYYTEMIAKEGMIGLMGCNAAPAMAPWGGVEAFMGTNPFAVAVYTGKDLLFSADMASSVVARGKIRKAAREGKSIPGDWALDAEGHQTTDPVAALKGTLLPMAGPKGSAIALAIDILAGILADAEHAPNIKSFHTPEGVTGVGAILIAINIRKFMDLQKFTSTIAEYFVQLKSMKLANNSSEILIPGEIEYRKELQSKENGIVLDDKAVNDINELLNQYGIKRHLESVE